MSAVVLFAWVHNAGRSQMAAAFFNALAEASKVTAICAGTQPAAQVHPVVPGLRRADWPIEDRKGLPIARVRVIRDDDVPRVASLVAEHGWERT